MIDETAKTKIFEADLPNIVRKVKAGKPLSAAERKIIADAAEKGDASSLPIYDSLAQCAASTGIPIAVLKRAKSRGCPAFRATRVHLGELLPWVFTHLEKPELDPVTERTRKLKAEADLLELEHKEKTRELVSLSEARELVEKMCLAFREAVTQLPAGWCARVNPQDPAFARAGLETWRDETLATLRPPEET